MPCHVENGGVQQVDRYSGVVAHGLDLAHIVIGFFAPKAAVIAMAISGPLYLLWFPLVARRLYQLGRGVGDATHANFSIVADS